MARANKAPFRDPLPPERYPGKRPPREPDEPALCIEGTVAGKYGPSVRHMRVHIPFSIVPKARPVVSQRGTYMPGRYQQCISDIYTLMCSAVAQRKPAWVMDGTYGVNLWILVARANSGDVDNLLGTVMDAGCGVLWQDDRQVVDAICMKALCPVDREPGASLTVCQYAGPSEFEATEQGSRVAKKRKVPSKVALRTRMSAQEYQVYLASKRR